MNRYYIPAFITIMAVTSAAAAMAQNNMTQDGNNSLRMQNSAMDDTARSVSHTLTKYPAVAMSGTTNPSAPVPGRNSFTRSQVQERLQNMGYENVNNLRLNENGVWQADTMRGGIRTPVQFDYQGNIHASGHTSRGK